MKAWIYQAHAHKQRDGDNAAWSVGWYEPDGTRKSKLIGERKKAIAFHDKTIDQLEGGSYKANSRKSWKTFRAEYQDRVLIRSDASTQCTAMISLDHFERIAKPRKLAALSSHTIDKFISIRRKDRGRNPGSTVSAATINKDLRHIKAALNVAVDWGDILRLPKFRMVREDERMGAVITDEHFQAIYLACPMAELLEIGQTFEAADWWQALLVFAITTGWRIGEILSLKRDDLDLDTGAVTTRAASNKGGRDDRDHLPAVALEHVKRIVGFDKRVFHWPHERSKLWEQFHVIQEAAGIHLACPDEAVHECTASCHVYGFHALRRGYATFNAELPAPVLQRKMRHRSFKTTLGYIQLADKMKKAADVIYVPAFLEAKRG